MDNDCKVSQSNLLLIAMIISYIIPISFVSFYYKTNNHSISSILSNPAINKTIFCMMIIMGIFTILYELNRNDYTSVAMVCSLLIGIYGILSIDESNLSHYAFASIIFISIIGFMIHHCLCTNCNYLYTFLLIEISLFILLIKTLLEKSPYFLHIEACLIINFAIYYIYLHYLNYLHV